MINFVRRLLPNWISPDPTVSDIVRGFDTVRSDLQICVQRSNEAAAQADKQAERAANIAAKARTEANTALRVSNRIQELLQ